MGAYIVRRILQAIPVLLGTTFLIYFMVFAMPGDPVVALFGDKTPPPQVLEQLRERYHLNEPFIVQYFIFLGNIFRVVGVAEEQVRQPEHSLLVCKHQRLPCCRVAICGVAD